MVAFFSVLFVEFGLVVVVDVPIPRAGHGVNGALALLETARRHLRSIPLVTHPPVRRGGGSKGGCGGEDGCLLGDILLLGVCGRHGF